MPPSEAEHIVAAIEDVIQAGWRAVDALTSAIARSSYAQDRIAENVPVAEALSGVLARGPRQQVALSMERYESALRKLRERSALLLIEREGLTFTEVGRRMGVSRHMVARLYNSARTADDED